MPDEANEDENKEEEVKKEVLKEEVVAKNSIEGVSKDITVKGEKDNTNEWDKEVENKPKEGENKEIKEDSDSDVDLI